MALPQNYQNDMALTAAVPIAERSSSSGSQDKELPKTAPEKPLTPFKRYSHKVWDEVKAANQELKLRETDKIVHQMWRNLSDDNKQEFVEQYENDQIEYELTVQAAQVAKSPQLFKELKRLNKVARRQATPRSASLLIRVPFLRERNVRLN